MAKKNQTSFDPNLLCHIINYSRFFDIAKKSSMESSRFAKIRDEQALLGNNKKLEVWGKAFSNTIEYAYITVVFSALSLESFINHYGFIKLGEDGFEPLDAINTIQKFRVFPKMATNADFDDSGECTDHLKWLFKIRNKIVHDKTKVVHADQIPTKPLADEHAAIKSIKAVSISVKEIQRIDSTFFTTWNP